MEPPGVSFLPNDCKREQFTSISAEVLEMLQCFMKNIIVRKVILPCRFLDIFENKIKYKHELQEGSIF